MKFSPNKLLCLLLAVCILSTTFVVPAFASTEVLSTDVYAEKTFNQYDQAKLKNAINALTSNPIFTDVKLAQNIYGLAFSIQFISKDTVGGILDQVFVTGYTASDQSQATAGETAAKEAINPMKCIVPTLYNKVPASLSEYFKGEPAANPTSEALAIGDILLMEDSSGDAIYIYDGKQMVNLDAENITRVNTETLFAKALAAERYVVLRPSLDMDLMFYSTPETDVLSDAQKALYETAEAYLMRGFRVQYDDLSPFTANEYRWQVWTSAPEESSPDNILYTNCAAFVTDVYKNALGIDTGRKTTAEYVYSKDSVWSYKPTGTETDEEKAAKEAEFYSNLQPGDIINVRYKSSSGHAMLYVGNGNIIHSGGSNYSLSTGEVAEASIKYMRVADLFDSRKGRYVFTKLKSINLVRPLRSWSGTVPQNTINRNTTMKGIVASKTTSISEHKTINPGTEITYTFDVYNTNDEAKTLAVTDVVPANTTYVSGDMTVSGSNLSYSLTVPANDERTISYKVKVNDNTPQETWIKSEDAQIGGVIHKATPVLVKETLTKAQQDAILTASVNNKSKASSTDKGIAYANAIYKEVLNVDKVIHHTSLGDMLDEMRIIMTVSTPTGGTADTTYAEGDYLLKKDSYYVNMIAPKMLGGRMLFFPDILKDQIVTSVKREQFVPGDILLDYAKSASSQKLYMYTETGLLDLTTGNYVEDLDTYFDRIFASNLFAVLRPSLAETFEYTEPEPEEPEVPEVPEDNTIPEEVVKDGNGKVWFALDGNSKFYMEYGSKEYNNRLSATDYLPGLDYGGTINPSKAPTGVFATDLANINRVNGWEKVACFPYVLDASSQATSKYKAYFNTKNGNVYWTVKGVDYLVKPDRKTIKIVPDTKTTNTDKSTTLTDRQKADYKALGKAVIDVPDDRYEEIGILAGIFYKQKRYIVVNLVYEDSVTSITDQKVVGVGYDDASEDGAMYFPRMDEDVTLGGYDYHSFAPYTFKTDPTKILKSIEIIPTNLYSLTSAASSYRYPVHIVSAWGQEVPDVSGEMSIVYKKNETPYTQVSITNSAKMAGLTYKVVNGFFNNAGMLLGSVVTDGVSTADEKQTISITLNNIPANTYEIRAFMFSSLDELKPLAPAKTATEQQ